MHQKIDKVDGDECDRGDKKDILNIKVESIVSRYGSEKNQKNKNKYRDTCPKGKFKVTFPLFQFW